MSCERPTVELVKPTDGQIMPKGWQLPSPGVLENFYRSRALGMVPTYARQLVVRAMEVPADEIASRHTREVVDNLRRAADLEREAGRKLVGLAANQMRQTGPVGRIALVDLGTSGPDVALSELTPIIDPLFVPDEGAYEAVGPEGCFSCGPVFSRVRRPMSGMLLSYDPQGRYSEVPCIGYPARVVGHETDHLDGILAPELVIAQGDSLDWRYPELKEQYADAIKGGEPWPYDCPSDQWAAMRAGTYRLEDFRPAA
jgi:peptide deformylase